MKVFSLNKYDSTEIVLQDGTVLTVMTDKLGSQEKQITVPEKIIDVAYVEVEND